ncbi:kinase-like domain-containing protein [Obelidium mucronatum]|nr:kinase-like domain-containing protein [Obelidium mucronatum]
MACAVAAATVVSEEIVQAQFARMRSLKLQLDDVTLEASKLKAELTTQQAAHTMEILNQANAHQEERRILLQKTKEMAHATAAAAAATEKTLRNQLLHWNLMANMTTTVNGSLEQKLVDATFTASCLREKVEGLQLSGFELLQELEEVKEQAPFPSPTRFKVGTLLPDLLKTLDSKTEYKNQFSPTGVNLGEGGFSKVVEVTQISTGRLCAVKTLDARKKARTFMELFATFQLRHDNLVETLGIFLTNRNEVSVVMPRMVLSLDHLVDERPLAHHLTAFVVSQVARALRYIHGMDMAHKDVKPANILIGNDGSVKLADFGLVEVVYLGTALYDTNGTSGFMAPEQLRGAGHDQLSDIWSLGVSTFHCLNGSNYVDAEECVVQLLIDGVRGVPANYGSPEISKYFDGVLELNPKERWTAADVMECDFITTVARDAQEEFLAYVLLAV